jgi:hypothetical protein
MISPDPTLAIPSIGDEISAGLDAGERGPVYRRFPSPGAPPRTILIGGGWRDRFFFGDALTRGESLIGRCVACVAVCLLA